MGILQATFVGSSAGVVNPLSGGTAAASGGSAPTIGIYSDGTIHLAVSGGTQNWYSPTTAGIGLSYYVRITKASGDAEDYNGASTWTNINGAPGSVYVSYTESQAKSGTFTIEISSDASGTPVVTSGTYSMQVSP